MMIISAMVFVFGIMTEEENELLRKTAFYVNQIRFILMPLLLALRFKVIKMTCLAVNQ